MDKYEYKNDVCTFFLELEEIHTYETSRINFLSYMPEINNKDRYHRHRA